MSDYRLEACFTLTLQQSDTAIPSCGRAWLITGWKPVSHSRCSKVKQSSLAVDGEQHNDHHADISLSVMTSVGSIALWQYSNNVNPGCGVW